MLEISIIGWFILQRDLNEESDKGIGELLAPAIRGETSEDDRRDKVPIAAASDDTIVDSSTGRRSGGKAIAIGSSEERAALSAVALGSDTSEVGIPPWMRLEFSAPLGPSANQSGAPEVVFKEVSLE